MQLKDKFTNAYVGVNVSKRKNYVRLNPYIEIRGDPEDLKEIQQELLIVSVGSTVRGRFLRIQGIQNCKIIAPFTHYDWFQKIMLMYDSGDHLTEEGQRKILSLVPRTDKSRTKRNRIML